MKKAPLGYSLVTGAVASAGDLADDESPAVLHEVRKIGPELVVGDALLDFLVLADELEEDEAANEVQAEANEEAGCVRQRVV